MAITLRANDFLVNTGNHHLHFRVYPGVEPAALLEAGGEADARTTQKYTIGQVRARQIIHVDKDLPEEATS